MTRAPAVLGSVILSASLLAAPALAFSPERAGIMVDAVRANGCQMAGSEASGALEPLGLDAIEVQSFVEVLYAADLVTLSDDSELLILSEGLCAADADAAMEMIVAAFAAQELGLEPWRPDFEPARGAALIGILRDNDCAMTDEQAAVILPGQDFSPELTRDIVSLLLDVGLADVSPDAASVRLGDDLCNADAAQDLAVIDQALASWHEANDAPDAAGGEAGQ